MTRDDHSFHKGPLKDLTGLRRLRTDDKQQEDQRGDQHRSQSHSSTSMCSFLFLLLLYKHYDYFTTLTTEEAIADRPTAAKATINASWKVNNKNTSKSGRQERRIKRNGAHVGIDEQESRRNASRALGFLGFQLITYYYTMCTNQEPRRRWRTTITTTKTIEHAQRLLHRPDAFRLSK